MKCGYQTAVALVMLALNANSEPAAALTVESGPANFPPLGENNNLTEAELWEREIIGEKLILSAVLAERAGEGADDAGGAASVAADRIGNSSSHRDDYYHVALPDSHRVDAGNATRDLVSRGDYSQTQFSRELGQGSGTLLKDRAHSPTAMNSMNPDRFPVEAMLWLVESEWVGSVLPARLLAEVSIAGLGGDCLDIARLFPTLPARSKGETVHAQDAPIVMLELWRRSKRVRLQLEDL